MGIAGGGFHLATQIRSEDSVVGEECQNARYMTSKYYGMGIRGNMKSMNKLNVFFLTWIRFFQVLGMCQKQLHLWSGSILKSEKCLCSNLQPEEAGLVHAQPNSKLSDPNMNELRS